MYKIWIIALVSLAYLPFMNTRVLRMAGDEKVYVAQSIEMARDGRWFVQTLADQPDYYKGPMHYVLTRIGLKALGPNLSAALYMNFLFALAAALACYAFSRKRLSEGAAFLFGISVALNVGVFSHAMASQMEVELCALYALALAALGWHAGKKPTFRTDIWFWAIAGVAGWSKSPIHSLLLGLGGVLFWATTGRLKERLRAKGPWLAVLAGVGICVGGYAPAFFLDRENFMAIFIGRENVQKPSNGRHVDYVLRSFPHFLFPWTGAVLTALCMTAWSFIRRGGVKLRGADPLLIKLGWSIALPTLIFFCVHPYKGQNYNLPVISGLLAVGFGTFQTWPRWSSRFAAVLLAALAVGCGYFVAHFWGSGPNGAPFPHWLALEWLLLPVFLLPPLAYVFWTTQKPALLASATAVFFLALAAAVVPFGEREMDGVRRFLVEKPQATVHYYNLEPTIWSEWGLLELALHRPIFGLHRPEQLKAAVQPGHVILVPGDEALKMLQRHAKDQHVDISALQAATWKRWMTKGKDPATGQNRFAQAWRDRSFTPVERDFYILWR